GPRNYKKPNLKDEIFFEERDSYGEEEKWWWIFQNPLGVIIMIAVAIIIVIGLWFVFKAPSSKHSDVQDGVIIVKSEGTSYKEAPDESTNQGVENQDKEVYKRLGQHQSEDLEASETIAKLEEKPLETNQFPETEKPEAKKALDEPSSLRKITESVGVKMPAPAVNEQFISEKKQDAVVDEDKPAAEAPIVAQKKVTEKPKAVKGLSDGSYTIRIASLRKQETADRELQRVVDTLGSVLHGVGRLVKKIESDSGTFYVVVIGAFTSLSKAKQTVKLLKDKNFDGIIQKVNR
ncbi:MAG: SPOR domain-containing protein, partial [Alphaproteobacteria bacterium]|nr:SPOR domain-containing protein [Alphaproteobacteria bacterium]